MAGRCCRGAVLAAGVGAFPLPSEGQWLTSHPPQAGAAAAIALAAVHGGRACLAKLGGWRDMALRLCGQPVTRTPAWLPESGNLACLPLASTEATPVGAFLAPFATPSVWRAYRQSGP